MKFAIIGAGAVGLLTACFLKEAGNEVQLVTRRAEQAKLINEQGVLKGAVHYEITADRDWKSISPEAFIIVAVKYDGLKTVLSLLQNQALTNPVIFLQNGMLHLKAIEKLPQPNIAAASVEHGVVKLSDNKIRHTGHGVYKFALLKGEESVFRPLAVMPGVQAEWHNNADQLLFRKVLLNTLINPLTALMALKNGELLSNPYAFNLLESLYGELAGSFPEMESLLPFEEVAALCNSTAENTSSMLADKLAGRKMELDTILLYTLNRSKKELPILRSLYQLLKSTEV
ncbi:2-dehydropantoate 2-reductase [Planomicrobium sp. CPCC 101079]|uniref:2-dehydropantoate 2-reductase n=1 Tax=Planomicrobium sp. CPCC 101079 TaxID=2599618 RepID=UPI0011B6B195|nr:2-dehydropantoate 2-reductase [Planomicrobium sp. CPCC 101079]TWT04727.1 2-dehydropantoate 2-reductase [Planomicrobium sp. CPCC 101079]